MYGLIIIFFYAKKILILEKYCVFILIAAATLPSYLLKAYKYHVTQWIMYYIYI